MTSVRDRGHSKRTGAATLPSDGRANNLSLVRRTLHADGAMSRADLSRTLGLTRVTVSDLVSDLMDRGHVVELGQSGEVRPGKPAILVDINRQGLQVIGVDLSGETALRAAVLDLDGNILESIERPLGAGTGTATGQAATGQAVVEQVLELVADTAAKATAPLLGIGVGTPGIVSADGVVLTAPNLGWNSVPLRELLEEHTGLPTLVSNDADAAVHADHTFGGGCDDEILVKIGRGVGSGVIVGGRRARGAHSAAGEIGHVTVGTDPGALCVCGRTGCLETWMSVPSLERALADAAAGDSPEAATAVVYQEAGERLAIALAPVVGVLDLAEVVLAGPRHLLGGPLLDAVQQTLLARLLHQDPAPVTVRLAADPQDIVLRGAAVMVLWNQLGVA
ncbi:ROK family transcriptional regulator [Arthrobacter cupressi]|uniref:Sugar kinase of the NBD/HSP70 family, may contain an N-terminal HTH domain n=1 Tax=Arthrobacter cupressi TaxID=1045773 RepID=A0A1G8LLK3_9MICC|nr:ROK family transcriptional regulator [Arthrobacter cupressi]NYD77586.1 putative NBD/HSP70 family sugar kinase/biotin operon repressor [Arthrobacter cupressi]SDI56523.1 Sugar kinase of the NBD/HSP70 family, may contain an N-terminal HTH domain [Arthrobacter cupressi]